MPLPARPIDRDAPYDALFELLQKRLTGKVATFSRRLRARSQVPPEERPALFLTVGNQAPKYEVEGFSQPRWTLGAVLYLYVTNTDPDPNIGPGVQLNELIREIEAALQHQDDDTHTPFAWNTNLGGLVDSLWIAHAETDEGLLLDDGEAVILVSMIAAPA